MSEDLAFAGATRQAELVRAGEVSPRELVELHLERIERLEPQLNAFRVVLAEQALAEADRVAERLAAGEELPLAGVPVGVKDSVDVAGEVTTLGTGAFTERAAEDCEMVRRLRAAGAVIAGKNNLPELAAFGVTESGAWGVTRNPWDLERTPGGSSGGSAAAVAAAEVPLATASDGAGSIRIPAASCGLFGLKPSRGRIPLDPDIEHWHGLSVNGCEARSVADSALFLDVTSGGSREPGAPPPPERPFTELAATPPPKLRIATSVKPVTGIIGARVGADARGAVAATAELLRSLGHETAERDPRWGLVANGFTPRLLRGVHDDAERAPHPERLDKRTRGLARAGGWVSDGMLRRGRRQEEKDRARLLSLFDDFDVLMTPVMAGTAAAIDRWTGNGGIRTLNSMARFYCFTAPWNHIGAPAASVPAGIAADGLPLSVQLIAPPGQDGLLLSLAAQLEAERPWADARPPVS